ncbi:hypothetical protein DRN38_03800 [Thermococci archaeon]|nr:MAG: hypothetical protein DRN38_03800 [Thermococci archaeon]
MPALKSVKNYLGEIVPAGILLLSYNQYSLGWRIGARLVKEEIEAGGFGIITNVAIPFRKLCIRMKLGGLDIIKEGEAGNLAVINVFKENLPYDFVYSIGDVDANTFIPKYVEAQKRLSQERELRNRRVVHAFVTLSTLYERFGEETMRQLFIGRLLAGERLVRRGFNFWDILIVNRDSLPETLHSWMISISDYVIMTQGILKENEFVENIAIIKGLSRDFKPVVLQVKTPTILIPTEGIY